MVCDKTGRAKIELSTLANAFSAVGFIIRKKNGG